MPYQHVQRGALHLVVYGSALLMLLGAWLARAELVPAVLLVATAVPIALLGACFHRLSTEDEGDRLSVRYGPLPLFGTRIPYSDIRDAARDRTRVIDGWGIHWVLGRGWTYNLWGFDCVRLTLRNNKVIRIGTDDPEGLATLVCARLSTSPDA